MEEKYLFEFAQVGKEFTYYTGRELKGIDGSIFEALEEHGYLLTIHLNRMTDREKQVLCTKKISVAVFQDTDSFILAMIQFGSSGLIYQLTFDPTKYEDDRAFQLVLKCNLITVIGIDSSNSIVQTIRTASMPNKLRDKLMNAWTKAIEDPDHSRKYANWIADLESRYSIEQLWNMATYVGKMGG